MKGSRFNKHSSERVFRLQGCSLFIAGILGFAIAIALAWFVTKGTLNFSQQNRHWWPEVQKLRWESIIAPTVVLFLTVVAVMKISPQPQNRSRTLVVGILLALIARYALWRSLCTLNLTNPLNGVFSLGLFFMEMCMLGSSAIQLFLMLNVKDRRREADQLALSVVDGIFTPSVDILIPTYNEAPFILRRTIIGCQALDYPNKKIYLLDDTKRPEMRLLAQELGCEYIFTTGNIYAKAGNLNNALPKTKGELIVVFDADFVPTKNFLNRTIGFFKDNKIALVQTPQSFYNADPIARNLGLEKIITSEEEVFYRQIQPIRDAAGSVLCSGTSFIVRRSALEEIGGFVTDSLSEDYFTGIRLSARGYRLIYLNEKLSAGLAAENISAHATQRQRWGRGTLQAFFIDENPLTIPGLSPLQRLAHLEGLLYWFTTLPRVYFLIVPLIYSVFGIVPLRSTTLEWLYYFLPYYVVQVSVFSWLNYRSRSALLSDIYTLVLCFPLALTAIQVMFKPFSKGFKVMPKGMKCDRYFFNWRLALPLIIVFIATIASLCRALEISKIPSNTNFVEGTSLVWIWSVYNLLIISVALLTLVDVPKPDLYEWFDLRRVVQLNVSDQTFWGMTTMISEVGAEVALTHAASFPVKETLPIKLMIMQEELHIQGKITKTGFSDELLTVRVEFEQVSLQQHRRLVEMLFCRPGQWKSPNTPGELRSLWLLLKVLLRPKFLFDKNPDVSAIAVSKI